MKRLFSQLFKHATVLFLGLASAFCTHAGIIRVSRVEHKGESIYIFGEQQDGYLKNDDKKVRWVECAGLAKFSDCAEFAEGNCAELEEVLKNEFYTSDEESVDYYACDNWNIIKDKALVNGALDTKKFDIQYLSGLESIRTIFRKYADNGGVHDIYCKVERAADRFETLLCQKNLKDLRDRYNNNKLSYIEFMSPEKAEKKVLKRFIMEVYFGLVSFCLWDEINKLCKTKNNDNCIIVRCDEIHRQALVNCFKHEESGVATDKLPNETELTISKINNKLLGENNYIDKVVNIITGKFSGNNNYQVNAPWYKNITHYIKRPLFIAGSVAVLAAYCYFKYFTGVK